MEEEDLSRLAQIARQTWSVNGDSRSRLSDNEPENLSIKKGTLTEAERQIINNHAAVSLRMLSQFPFSRSLKSVAEFAGGHHEKLNGKGYPQGTPGEKLPLQARILAVADVFEALTASDRPYRKPMPLSNALKILGFMVKDGELDGKVVDLFVESGVAKAYAEAQLDPGQIDV